MNDVATWRRVAFRRRLLLVVLVAIQTTAGLALFYQGLPGQAGNWTVTSLLLAFGVLFAWIGVGFWTAVFGFVALRRGGDPWSLASNNSVHARPSDPASEPATVTFAPTAIVMPIYHEPVQRALGGLRAIYQELAQHRQAEVVDFYVLSDSRNPEVWLEEQAACDRLREELGAHHRLFYRRRRVNQNYKSGNIADFLRRWGRKYRYMVVLDADSLLSAGCITRLIQLMESRPQAGIIQTAPRLARAETRFARLQQFANRCYGRLYGAGLAAIQLGEAAYWGHNAIIRVAPFMRHCGLRKLQGPGLFRGAVLSHDFIEAALMGRAGYEVWLEPAIGGSYEESPPTFEDDLTRDRRWCRGNLQHLWLLATLGKLRFAHRMALLTGIVSYLASPLWLVFLGLSGFVALATPDSTPALPGILANGGRDSGVVLIVMTALMLFGPRLLALTDLALTGRAVQFGGARKVVTSTMAETLIMLALAPVRMFAHTIFVLRALLNLNLNWQGQNRTGNTDLRTSVLRFGLPMILAAITLGLTQWQAPGLTLWALPVILPVLLVPFLAGWLNGVPSSQSWLAGPENQHVPPIIDRACSVPAAGKRWKALSWVEYVVLAPDPARPRHSITRTITGKKQKTLNQLVDRCEKGGKSALNHFEMSLICSHPTALEALHHRAWNARSGTPWHNALARLALAAEPRSTTIEPLTSRQREDSLWIDAAS